MYCTKTTAVQNVNEYNPDEAGFRIIKRGKTTYLYISRTEFGFDHYYLNDKFEEIDGGSIDCECDITMYEALIEAVKIYKCDTVHIRRYSTDKITGEMQRIFEEDIRRMKEKLRCMKNV